MTTYLRADWGSTGDPGGYPMGRAREFYVHHFNSGIQAPTSFADCAARMRGAQAYHRSQGWGDIGYSWCISDNGDVYEGRGWGRTGAHTYGYNSVGYAGCWLGDSNVSQPSRRALEAYAELIRSGIAAGWLTADVTIVGHRDRVPDTSCPGDVLEAQIATIRALVADDYPPQPITEDEDMLRSMVRSDGSVIIIDGHTFTVMPGPWPAAEQGLRQMIAAGLLAGAPDGSPVLTPINDTALATLRQV